MTKESRLYAEKMFVSFEHDEVTNPKHYYNGSKRQLCSRAKRQEDYH